MTTPGLYQITYDHILMQLLLIVSVFVMLGIIAGAVMVWKSNGVLMNSCALMLFLIAVEIIFATVSNEFIAYPAIYSSIKIAGRLVEFYGVMQFLKVLWKRSRQQLSTAEIESEIKMCSTRIEQLQLMLKQQPAASTENP